MNIAVFNPVGIIASQEKSLLIFSFLLMLIVVIPVMIMIIAFAYRYRASNTKAKYSPNWSHSTILEIIWWGIPTILIIILGTVTWKTTHKLDPYRPLEHSTKPIEIQAIALDWKWLFIYPDYNIATVNFIQFPVDTPLNFKITADAPMNALAIPQLGGQIYAMQGMETQIHWISEKEGEFKGYSSNYSGRGFSGMNFIAKAVTQEEFEKWVEYVRTEGGNLTQSYYDEKLLPQTVSEPVQVFSSVEKNLYRGVIDKFMMSHGSHSGHSMEDMKHDENVSGTISHKNHHS
jgi:cytochrome o ubiquinol oxidase subunit 2